LTGPATAIAGAVIWAKVRRVFHPISRATLERETGFEVPSTPNDVEFAYRLGNAGSSIGRHPGARSSRGRRTVVSPVTNSAARAG
jgi:hypothetical protein